MTESPVATAALTVSSAKSTQGKEVSVDIAVEGNPGLAVINFRIDYDKTRLELTGYKDGLLSDWEVGIGKGEKAVWVDTIDNTGDGTILTLTFKVLDEAEDGFAEIMLTEMQAGNADENRIGIIVTAGGVTVTTRVAGDINGDGAVDAFALLRMKKYLAGSESSIEEYNADVNGDGSIDAFDLLRLKKYLGGADTELK